MIIIIIIKNRIDNVRVYLGKLNSIFENFRVVPTHKFIYFTTIRSCTLTRCFVYLVHVLYAVINP